MQYRIFAIPASGSIELEEEMNHFLRSHKVISVQKSLENRDGSVRWCFCIEYLEEGFGNFSGKKGKNSRRVDYKEVLSEEDFALYVKVRELRKELAQKEAVPVYTICTNEQLASMVQSNPEKVSDLRKIEGFGEAKMTKYGEDFIRVLTERT